MATKNTKNTENTENTENQKQSKELETDQKNRDFIQFYRGHIDDITILARENGTAYDLFMTLCKHMDGTNALGVTNATLSEILSISVRTVQRAVRYLSDNGWICVLKNGTSNVYVVNPDIAWTSYNNQKQYCKFQASVLLSSTENAEYLNNPKASNHFKTIDPQFVKMVQEREKLFRENCETIRAS